jgi:isopentenyl-diphosphate Delta-isomerase
VSTEANPADTRRAFKPGLNTDGTVLDCAWTRTSPHEYRGSHRELGHSERAELSECSFRTSPTSVDGVSETARAEVELVDEDGRTVGVAGKLEAHVAPGLLHRAVSVFLRDDDLILLQRRASTLYHFAGRWSNTCCTHPRPGESPIEAARRRLYEEMGLRADVKQAGILRYEARDPATGLVEREHDHVFIGYFRGPPRPDERIVSDWQWLDISTVRRDQSQRPDEYTPWLVPALDLVTGS